MKVSFEVFPPKTEAGIESLKRNIDRYSQYHPDMMTVTHGANGSNVGCQLDILKYISDSGIEACANLTCINKKIEDIYSFCQELRKISVHKILALRGDIPEGQIGTGGDFEHASDLIRYIKFFNNNEIIGKEREFDILAADYPEGHIESNCPEEEYEHYIFKGVSGASHFISQMCYDTEYIGYGINSLNTYVGVMPVLNRESITSMCLKNGCSIPKDLSHIIGRYYNDPDSFKKAGIEYTIKLIEDISALKPYGFQIFTMNRFEEIKDILDFVAAL